MDSVGNTALQRVTITGDTVGSSSVSYFMC